MIFDSVVRGTWRQLVLQREVSECGDREYQTHWLLVAAAPGPLSQSSTWLSHCRTQPDREGSQTTGKETVDIPELIPRLEILPKGIVPLL